MSQILGIRLHMSASADGIEGYAYLAPVSLEQLAQIHFQRLEDHAEMTFVFKVREELTDVLPPVRIFSAQLRQHLNLLLSCIRHRLV